MQGLDCGTMFLVKSSLDEIDETDVSFEIERNVFAEVRNTLDDPEQVLKENNYAYVKHKDKYYVVGEDVFKVHAIESLFKKSGGSSYFSDVRRPMKDGLINTAEDKMAIAIIQAIIKQLVGKPKYENEVLCFCAPGDPINSESNVIFHRTMLHSFISSLGYHAECINEALAIIYSECPVADDPDEPDGKAKFSGISLSFGSGMVNCALSWKQIPLLNFSMTHSGDWIDQEAAKIAGCDVATITKFKEKHLDLDNIDTSDVKQMALDIYYQAMIKNAMTHFASKFQNLDDNEKRDTPLEIVVAGGTASVPGFVSKFESVLEQIDLPFAVKCVRLAKNPLYAVSNGCLVKAISIENKLNQNKTKTKTAIKPEPKQESQKQDISEETSKQIKEKAPQKIKLNRE